MRKRLSVFVVLAAAVVARSLPALAADLTIRGHITDPDGLPLPGVVVTLAPSPDGVPTVVTDGSGLYSLTAPPGHYELKAQLTDFDSAARTVDLSSADATVDITLRLAAHQEAVTVKGDQLQSVVGQPHPAAPVTVTREVVDSGMLPNSQYDDVLPLLPNVVRGPDGLISVAGARAFQGALFVNGSNETDPVSGEPGISLPLEAVDSLDVFSGGYSAELGRATGGVTAAHTRPGADQFRSSANSFFPRFRFKDGRVEGVDYWEPNAGMSGPIIKGKLFFEEAVSYRFDRNHFETLVGTQHQKFNELAAWTQFNVKLSPRQDAFASFCVNPQNTDHANLTAFTPPDTVPSLSRRAFTAALGDRLTVGEAATLELRANVIRTGLELTPNGKDPYAVGHDLTHGSYFDQENLQGGRVEGAAVYSWTAASSHFLKVGTSVARSRLSGDDLASAVTLLRSNGSAAQSIQFLNSSILQASANEFDAFVHDTWTVSPAVTIDGGVRYDATTATGQTWSPRVAWTVKLPGNNSTIGGSVGLFGDKVPLEARVFPSLPGRMIQSYDESGAPLGPARILANTIGGPLKTPIATRWDVEFDRHLSANWLARVKYQERYGRDELVVTPLMLSESTGLLALQSTGISQSRSIEATIAYRGAQDGHEVYVSYVRSRTRGNLNSFDFIEGVAKQPFVQPDEIGPLAADVPNRVLTWGVLHLPEAITIAPFLEIRSGFPFSAIAEDWTYVGLRNSYRFPWFGSLDLYVNKVFNLGDHLPAARIGLKIFSLASAHTERDVQADIMRSDFGTFYNPIGRFSGGVFELLWGHK
jgi:hypothetical protein